MRAARVWLELGDREHCLDLLEVAYEDRDIWLPRIHNRAEWYDPLHDKPRYQELVAEMGPAPVGVSGWKADYSPAEAGWSSQLTWPVARS